MTREAITPLNYTFSAIDDLHELERNCLREAPYTAYVLRNVINLLESSVKFILPNCADFIAPEDLRQTHLDLARLPYPVVTFEIPWEKDVPLEQYSDMPVLRSTKRIALCWEAVTTLEPVPGINRMLEHFPGGGVFVCSVYWVDQQNRWQMNYGGMFYPYDNQLNKTTDISQRPFATRLAVESLQEAGLVKKAQLKQFSAEPFIALPEFAERAESMIGSRDKLMADIMINTRDELQSFINACSVLNCANVIVDTITPADSKTPRFIRGKRVKAPDPAMKPRFTYKVLQISDEQRSVTGGEGSSTGSHTKRMHLRRGHIRRWGERLIWIRPSVVNPGSAEGVVTKDYQLKKSAD
ncbi:hypothetical protein MK936_004502 [Salmonella enterica]|nr:hypothetical protein [Salmonella enterica]